jgi:hypothetical protein
MITRYHVLAIAMLMTSTVYGMEEIQQKAQEENTSKTETTALSNELKKRSSEGNLNQNSGTQQPKTNPFEDEDEANKTRGVLKKNKNEKFKQVCEALQRHEALLTQIDENIKKLLPKPRTGLTFLQLKMCKEQKATSEDEQQIIDAVKPLHQVDLSPEAMKDWIKKYIVKTSSENTEKKDDKEQEEKEKSEQKTDEKKVTNEEDKNQEQQKQITKQETKENIKEDEEKNKNDQQITPVPEKTNKLSLSSLQVLLKPTVIAFFIVPLLLRLAKK